MPKIKKPQTLIQWGNEEVTALELFKELDRLVAQPVMNLYEMEGDMYLSDYRKLSEAQWRISSTIQLLKGDTDD